MQFIETLHTRLDTITCGVCGVPFALPEQLHSNMKEGRCYHCPNGHSITYTKSETQRLRDQLEAKERELRKSKCETLNERNLREKAERKLKRVGRGVCPCCNRTFNNLARHMATKHPKE